MSPPVGGGWHADTLWSLWDMLVEYGLLCFGLSESLQNVISGYKSLGMIQEMPKLPLEKIIFRKLAQERRAQLDEGQEALGGILVRDLPKLKLLAEALSLKTVAPKAERIERLVERKAPTDEIKTAISELSERIVDELKHEKFLHVAPKYAALYGKPELFGAIVNDRFPGAIDDIEEAGKCLALGQGTACVLHLMRVMEAGLKALGALLGIPYAPSWESYLTQISTQIGLKRPHKSIDWIRDEPFFRDVSGDLLTVKQAFRNPTMHVVRKYSQDEAGEVFAAARSFMTRLASHPSFAPAEPSAP